MVTPRTLEGCKCFSSLRDTRFDGETSMSYRRREVEGEYACRDEGWDEVRIRDDEGECTASGVEFDGVSGSKGAHQLSSVPTCTPALPSFNRENVREIFSDSELMNVYAESERPSRYSSPFSPADEMAIVEMGAPTLGTNSFLFVCSCQMTKTASSPPLSR